MLWCGGCRAAYLARLAVEEARYLGSAKPVTEWLATTGDDERRRALEALVEVRAFAVAEGLDVGGSYREVSDTGAVAPFHVVTAAWSDRLEAYTWWYPVIGAIPYRGYFDRGRAERFAAGLGERGFDTRIVEAAAYSTLGWLDDPLPSSVVDRGEQAVVVTVLHELVHQTFFAPGQVAFNETLATAAAWRLAARYCQGRGDDDCVADVEAMREAWLARSDVLDEAAARLRAFFDDARKRRLSRDRLLAEREAIYAEVLAAVGQADPAFARALGETGLDNASFLAEHRYATEGRVIDAYFSASPTVAGALAELARAVADGRDPAAHVRAVVARATAPR